MYDTHGPMSLETRHRCSPLGPVWTKESSSPTMYSAPGSPTPLVDRMLKIASSWKASLFEDTSTFGATYMEAPSTCLLVCLGLRVEKW